jgi:hypothetical protein
MGLIASSIKIRCERGARKTGCKEITNDNRNNIQNNIKGEGVSLRISGFAGCPQALRLRHLNALK